MSKLAGALAAWKASASALSFPIMPEYDFDLTEVYGRFCIAPLRSKASNMAHQTHTSFPLTLWWAGATSQWNERKRKKKPLLPTYLPTTRYYLTRRQADVLGLAKFVSACMKYCDRASRFAFRVDWSDF
eukprot:1136135-Pelagomonas_calceolata.AAC.1